MDRERSFLKAKYAKTTDLLKTDEWIPEQLERKFSPTRVNTRVFSYHNPEAAWAEVRNAITVLNNYQKRKDAIALPGYVEDNKDYKYCQGDKVYHKSMEEVVEKYRDPWTAVVIFPNSWFDKKLNEAYNSKRTATPKSIDNE